MKKTPAHIFATAVPVTRWPRIVKALCGEKVKHPDAVLDFNIAECSLQGPRMTTPICDVCLVLLARPVSGVKHLYGVLPQEQAHRVNLRLETED